MDRSGTGHALVAISEPVLRAVACGVLDDHGLEVTRVGSDQALIEAAGRASHPVVVLTGSPTGATGTAQLLRELSMADPSCRVLVLHDEDDVASASVALRHGAHPCPVPAVVPAAPASQHVLLRARLEEVLAPTAPQDRLLGVVMARRALDMAADRRLLVATIELSRIDGTEATIAATESLTDSATSILRRIAQRSRYPVPADLLLERLTVPTDADVGICFAMVQRAAFRVAGVDLPLEEIIATHGARGALFGAFHSAHALVQFGAQRWWRSPKSILEEVRSPPRSVLHH